MAHTNQATMRSLKTEPPFEATRAYRIGEPIGCGFSVHLLGGSAVGRAITAHKLASHLWERSAWLGVDGVEAGKDSVGVTVDAYRCDPRFTAAKAAEFLAIEGCVPAET
jgi:hypothetical protein